MENGLELEFAYKYPFTEEAKSIFSKITTSTEEKLLKSGKTRVEEDLLTPNPGFVKISMEDIKYTYLLSYVYSRMLISAINNVYLIDRYAKAEARRASEALKSDSIENILKIAKELGLRISNSSNVFTLKFSDFLALSPRTADFRLIYQKIDSGNVSISSGNAITLIETAIGIEIKRNLPIKLSDLPKKVRDYSKTVKIPLQKVETKQIKGDYGWVELILANPIPDIRHRAVNLILAPYLVNVKGLPEEEAVRIILDYIERCKTLNPDTRINETYVKYQCKYAKTKGLRPLSFERAKELFKGILALEK